MSSLLQNLGKIVTKSDLYDWRLQLSLTARAVNSFFVLFENLTMQFAFMEQREWAKIEVWTTIDKMSSPFVISKKKYSVPYTYHDLNIVDEMIEKQRNVRNVFTVVDGRTCKLKLIRLFWKDIQNEMPLLARLVRTVLTISMI